MYLRTQRRIGDPHLKYAKVRSTTSKTETAHVRRLDPRPDLTATAKINNLAIWKNQWNWRFAWPIGRKTTWNELHTGTYQPTCSWRMCTARQMRLRLRVAGRMTSWTSSCTAKCIPVANICLRSESVFRGPTWSTCRKFERIWFRVMKFEFLDRSSACLLIDVHFSRFPEIIQCSPRKAKNWNILGFR